MATKNTSTKSETTKRGGRKGDPDAGSPVTIGGGGGIDEGNSYIEFVSNDWTYAAGKLTLKDGTKRIKFVNLGLAAGSIKLPDIGIEKMEITFD
jgi:hypothetical protein